MMPMDIQFNQTRVPTDLTSVNRDAFLLVQNCHWIFDRLQLQLFCYCAAEFFEILRDTRALFFALMFVELFGFGFRLMGKPSGRPVIGS